MNWAQFLDSMHASITLDRVSTLVADAEPRGLCTACGADVSGVEPDVHGDPCPECEATSVYGAEELLILLFP